MNNQLNTKSKKWLEIINSLRESVLANLSMISQIPANTFNEVQRTEFILSRFTEIDTFEPRTDKLHNAIAVSNGTKSNKTILISTHMDNQFDSSVDQNISIDEERVYGAGVADDNISLAVLLTLPDILEKLNLKLKSKLILLATTRYHGRGDFGGMRHFIKENGKDISATINLSGTDLDILNYFNLSRIRCDIQCDIKSSEKYSWQRMVDGNAILVINDIIDSLFTIPLPKKPRTFINVGMISGGERYSTICREACINIEVLSENDTTMDSIIEEISNRCIDLAARHGADVTTDFFGRHRASHVTTGHPLIKSALNIIKSMDLSPKMEYSNSQITISLEAGIPSVNIGVTTGVGGSSPRSYIDIDPISQGILQLIMLLEETDKGEW